jgi:hypothetical protein
MTSTAWNRVLAIVAVALITGCGGGGLTGPAASQSTLATDFQITVTSGTSPTISWPGGVANGLYIQEAPRTGAATAQEVWSFGACVNIFDPACGPNAGFASPVKYGTLPARGICGNPGNVIVGPAPVFGVLGTRCPGATQLQPGTTYIVVVDRVDGRVGATYITP